MENENNIQDNTLLSPTDRLLDSPSDIQVKAFRTFGKR